MQQLGPYLLHQQHQHQQLSIPPEGGREGGRESGTSAPLLEQAGSCHGNVEKFILRRDRSPMNKHSFAKHFCVRERGKERKREREG
jgi:hypothetical protein